MNSFLTRRQLLRYAPLAAATVMAACAQPAVIAPTPAPDNTSQPVSPTSTAAAQPTSTVLAPPSPTNGPTARPVVLAFEGASRPLPAHLFGGSVEALIEHLLDDPTKVAALAQTSPAGVRFPGGSQSNYYNWRTGLLNFDPQPDSSAYVKFWAAAAGKIAQAFPGGIKLEQYTPVARQIGADVILVPNLETSAVSEQVAWFQQLAAEQILPATIELGNEFYIAMAGDPASLKRWPDFQTAARVMQQFETALRPIAGVSSQFAIQSAASAFNIPANTTRPFQRRQLDWDAALAPAPWFEAVTAHLYPDPEGLAASAPGASASQLFDLFMGRADAGVDRVLDDIARRIPGKDIWITEWSPRGGNFADINNPNFHELVPPPLRAQLVARYELAFLRHPAVTKALYFTLNFTNQSVFQEYVQIPDGSYAPMDPAIVLGWFDDAANGGSSFQRVVEAQAGSRTGIGPFQESYRPIEGGFFRQGKRSVLILQNASGEPRRYDASQGGTKPWPAKADLLDSSDLTRQLRAAAQVTQLNPGQPSELPPYSLLRLVWE